MEAEVSDDREKQPDAAAPEPEAAQPEAAADPLAEAIRERDELKDKLLRMAADTDNYKKRAEREKAEHLKRANENLVRDLLPVLDNLERALEHAVEDEGPGKALTQGLELTYQELWKVLERFGLERVESLGRAFDPEYHEAMMQEEDPDAESGTVIRELQRGYLFQQRLLRPAMVVVSKRPAGEEDEAGEGESGQTIDITVH